MGKRSFMNLPFVFLLFFPCLFSIFDTSHLFYFSLLSSPSLLSADIIEIGSDGCFELPEIDSDDDVQPELWKPVESKRSRDNVRLSHLVPNFAWLLGRIQTHKY
jgi:hypothetical protein